MSIFRKVKKGLKKLANAAERAASKTWKIAKTGVEEPYDAVKNLVDTPKLKEPTPTAQAAPPPEQAKPGMEMAENISRRKRKRRNGLRIDLNTGGPPTGTGVNLPVG